MRVHAIPLEDITDTEYKVPYARAAEMMSLNGSSVVINELFADEHIKPRQYIDRFNGRRNVALSSLSGYFTADEMDKINEKYLAFANHKIANAKFRQEGYRNDLIGLLHKIRDIDVSLKRNKNGSRTSLISKIKNVEEKLLISPTFFAGIEDYLSRLPSAKVEALKIELRMLKDVFMMMLNTAGLVAETGDYYGAD